MTFKLTVVEHGTLGGYRAGCHGSRNSCGAAVSCAEVHTRYQGDWSFRRRVNAGESPAAIVAAELAEVDAVRARDRAAARDARRAADTKAKETTKRAKARKASSPTKIDRYRDDITRLNSEGLDDRTIAAELGESPNTIAWIRRRLGLAPIRRTPAPREIGPQTARAKRIEELHDQGFTDRQIASELGVELRSAAQTRRRLGLNANPEPRESKTKPERAPRTDHRPEVARLHAQGLTDSEIAEKLGLRPVWVGAMRRELGLPAVRSTRSKWDDVELAGHGTNARFARGCRCEPCHEAKKAYHRAYVKSRREEGAREYHGTAYGYQLGCRGRSACPGEMTCTDAMLAQDRERRRVAGVPPKELVDAAPMQAHVADLVHAGMSVRSIAEAAGIGGSALRKMIHSRGKERGIVRQVLAERAAAVLAVPLKEAA